MKTLKTFEFSTGDDRANEDGELVVTNDGVVVEINGDPKCLLTWDEMAELLATRPA